MSVDRDEVVFDGYGDAVEGRARRGLVSSTGLEERIVMPERDVGIDTRISECSAVQGRMR